ncbi:MAG TPA: hypothetical protein VEP69_03330, partial [Thermodesulfovibrionales bacterium]|nr:hypothetical protein [Thermodesulfovibrionales bacterium]
MYGKNGINNLIKNALYIFLLVLVDLIVLFLLFHAARYLRIHVLPFFYSGFPNEAPFRKLSNAWWLFPVWLFFLFYEGLYTRRLSFWDEVNAVWKAAFFSTVGIFAIVSIGKMSDIVSRISIIFMGFLSLIFLPMVRIEAKRLLYRVAGLRRRVLILGAGETGRLILKALRKEPNYGYDVIGFLDDDPAKACVKVDGLKVHSGVERAASYLRAGRVSDIIIAMPGAGKERIQNLINTLQHKAH